MPENKVDMAAWGRAAAKRQIEEVTGREQSSWADSSTLHIGPLPSVYSDLFPSVYSDVIYRTE